MKSTYRPVGNTSSNFNVSGVVVVVVVRKGGFALQRFVDNEYYKLPAAQSLPGVFYVCGSSLVKFKAKEKHGNNGYDFQVYLA